MNIQPPNGAEISITSEGSDAVIVIPNGNAGPMRYAVGLFLLFWLGG